MLICQYVNHQGVKLIQQNRKLLDFKGNPKYVLPSLQIFKKNEVKWKVIQSQLIELAKSLKSNAQPIVVVSAYITPMLRNLNLIEGDGSKNKLTADAIQCLLAYDKDGINGFKKRLAYQLIKIDENNAGIISYLVQNYNSATKSISVQNLKNELFSLGVTNAKMSSPVQGWIQLLEYVELVEKKGGNYYVMSSQIESIKNGEKEPTEREFAKGIEYVSKILKSPGSPYVPIPEFRDSLCTHLGISTFTFYRKIKQFPPTYGKMRIMLATPINRAKGGITLGKKYYYYIAVFL